MRKRTYLHNLLMNFRGCCEPSGRNYLPKNKAYDLLKHHTGEDFGDNFDKWEQWIDEHPNSIRFENKDISKMSTPFLKEFRKMYNDEE